MPGLNEIDGRLTNAPEWFSGRLTQLNEAVRSPTNGEVYRRKTATGAGAVDPYLDTTNYFAVSYLRTLAVTNQWSAGGAFAIPNPSIPSQKLTAIGMVKAQLPNTSTRNLVLDIQGRGFLQGVALSTEAVSNVATTHRVEIIVDTITVFDAVITRGSITASNGTYAAPLGFLLGASEGQYVLNPDPVEFTQRAQVYVTHSIAGAHQAYLWSSYKLRS